MAKYYRYEFYYENEYQGKGICTGMYHSDLNYYKCDELMAPFYEGLISPDMPKEMKKLNFVFFFTEAGMEKFRKPLQDIIDAFLAKKKSPYNIKILEVDTCLVRADEILYEDELQIAVIGAAYDRMKHHIRKETRK